MAPLLWNTKAFISTNLVSDKVSNTLKRTRGRKTRAMPLWGCEIPDERRTHDLCRLPLCPGPAGHWSTWRTSRTIIPSLPWAPLGCPAALRQQTRTRKGGGMSWGSPAPWDPWASPSTQLTSWSFPCRSHNNGPTFSPLQSLFKAAREICLYFNTSWTDVSFRNTGTLFTINQRSLYLCKCNEMSNWILRDRSATEAQLKLQNYTHQLIQLPRTV